MSAMYCQELPNPSFGIQASQFILNIVNREIKIHVYRIRQTANVSGEFLRIENKQLKKVQNDSCGQNQHKTTYFCVEAINGKRKIGGKTWSRGANSRLPFGVNVNLNLSNIRKTTLNCRGTQENS